MFHQALKRMREVAQENPINGSQRGRCQSQRVIEVNDLRELLFHFDRLDAEARMGYPPNIKELANAAENAVSQLPDGSVKRDLEFALNLVRPVAK